MNLKAKVVSDFSRHDVKSRTRIEVHEQRHPAKRSLRLFSAVWPTKVADYFPNKLTPINQPTP